MKKPLRTLTRTTLSLAIMLAIMLAWCPAAAAVGSIVIASPGDISQFYGLDWKDNDIITVMVVASDAYYGGQIEIPSRKTLNIVLNPNCRLTVGSGIHMSENATLSISGDDTGELIAKTSRLFASPGIGGGGKGIVINISGGTVTAEGGEYNAGIGGGLFIEKYEGTINISGGTVTAQGGKQGAGIGGCHGSSGGNINISGGRVTATGGKGGAGIGGGAGDGGHGGNIRITGGTVTATGGSGGAGIGGGTGGGSGTIAIVSGGIEATGGDGEMGGGAGIGSGSGSSAAVASIDIGPGVPYLFATGGNAFPRASSSGPGAVPGSTHPLILNGDPPPLNDNIRPFTQGGGAGIGSGGSWISRAGDVPAESVRIHRDVYSKITNATNKNFEVTGGVWKGNGQITEIGFNGAAIGFGGGQDANGAESFTLYPALSSESSATPKPLTTPSPGAKASTAQTSGPQTAPYEVITSKLWMRVGAGTDYAKAGYLVRGDLVRGVDLGNGWLKFTWNGKDVYASTGDGKYVKKR